MIKKPLKTPAYYLNKEGEFVIENYNSAKPFANFFPGIAGKYGIPIWVFYVNRGQAISSFGTKDKDHPILEFYPANKAWQFTASHGYRTFIKIKTSSGSNFYEPFHNGFSNLAYSISNKIFLSSAELRLEEDNKTLGIKTEVEYFTVPNDSYGALVRCVRISNTSNKTMSMQIIDGLPQIVPFGTNNWALKNMSRTIEAWMQVENLEKGVPFYKLAVDPADRPEVVHISEGNFYLGFHFEKDAPKISVPLVNPESVFGPVSDFSCPHAFLSAQTFKTPKNQIFSSKTPSALCLYDICLEKDETKAFYAVTGNIRNVNLLNGLIKKITHKTYIPSKRIENRTLIADLENTVATQSSSKAFDLYCKQTYLDNTLRGGYPVVFKSGTKESVFYVYSRKHGDIERDYNSFSLQPTYFSQGNGNYRDVNQNRRIDTWFSPDVKDENLIYFFNLLQTDGFNPLVVKGASFTLEPQAALPELLKGIVDEEKISEISEFLRNPFTPGDLIFFLEQNKIYIKGGYDSFLGRILTHSHKHQEAEHGEGFWSDHWTYNLDLLENFLNLYPENKKELLFQKRAFTFYDNTEIVRPRAEKYVLYHAKPRQLHSVILDPAKKELIGKRKTHPHIVRSRYGTGEIYKTTLINKLLCLTANKLASLDPSGVGIEMEANKPNWYDALNGLPALFGSSLCETFELKRLLLFIIDALRHGALEEIPITEEVLLFLTGLDSAIKEALDNHAETSVFHCWDACYSLKEEYRFKTRMGLSGDETNFSTEKLITMLENAVKKIDIGIEKVRNKKTKTYPSYFINQVVDYDTLKDHGIKPKSFKQIPVPLFLEGHVHALKLMRSLKDAKTLFEATKSSELYDKKLKMYKVTSSLKNMPEEIGRCRIFAPGWLENESIWLHMEYKYLLETLKCGLIKEFYADFKNLLVPFQDPKTYGRSTLENSSFIVSSAFADKNLHGNGFVARLSGSTAEFLQMWLIMNLGITPFTLDENNALNLTFKPSLAGWLFDKKGCYSFNFLSSIKVTYYNPNRKDTFGPHGVSPAIVRFIDRKGKVVELSSGTIPSSYAHDIRDRLIHKIEITLK